MYPYEKLLFDGLFADRYDVTLEDLKTTFSADMAKVQAQLYRNVTTQGWFRGNPNQARGAWAFAGMGIAAAGAAVTYWLTTVSGLAVITVPVVVVGIATVATSGKAPARTAEGTRVLMQTLG